MAYEQFEGKIIEGYKHDVDAGKVIVGNPDLDKNNSRRLYDKFTSEVVKRKFIEYHTKDFRSIEQKEFIDIACNVIFQIFGYNEKVLNDVLDYFGNMIIENSESFLDGVALSLARDDDPNFKEQTIILPSCTNLGAVVTAVHEFIHFHISKYKIPFEKKRYYSEIFSIYAEKLAAYYIACKHNGGQEFMKKIDSTRFESLKWWYGEQLPLVNLTVEMYNNMKSIALFDKMSRDGVMDIERRIPTIKGKNGTSIVKGYYVSQAESYGIGNIYSSFLFEKLLDDPRTTKDKVEMVLNGSLPIADLIKYYGMTLNRESTYEPVLRIVKKF